MLYWRESERETEREGERESERAREREKEKGGGEMKKNSVEKENEGKKV